MTEDKPPLTIVDADSKKLFNDLVGVLRNNLGGNLENAGKSITDVMREAVNKERPLVFNHRQAIVHGVIGGELSKRYDMDDVVEQADMCSYICNNCGEIHAAHSEDMRGERHGSSMCDGKYEVHKAYFGNKVKRRE